MSAGTSAPAVLVLREDDGIGGVNVIVSELCDGLRAAGWPVTSHTLAKRPTAADWHAARLCDVILATNNFRPAYAAWLLGAILRKPVVAWVHGPVADVLEVARAHPFKRMWLRWLYRRLSHLVFNSQHTQASFEAFAMSYAPESGRHIIYNAVLPRGPVPSAMPSDEGGAVELGYVGRLSPEKQPEILVGMLRLLPTHFRLTLVGDGPMRAALEAQAQDLVHVGRLRLAGACSRDLAFNPNWRLTLLASRYEGACPLSALESMAAGIPVVAPSLPALRETMLPEAGAFLAPDASPQALAAAVQMVLALPAAQVRTAMASVLARHRPETFLRDWQRVLCRAAKGAC